MHNLSIRCTHGFKRSRHTRVPHFVHLVTDKSNECCISASNYATDIHSNATITRATCSALQDSPNEIVDSARGHSTATDHPTQFVATDRNPDFVAPNVLPLEVNGRTKPFSQALNKVFGEVCLLRQRHHFLVFVHNFCLFLGFFRCLFLSIHLLIRGRSVIGTLF